jgi:hypothetical protein
MIRESLRGQIGSRWQELTNVLAKYVHDHQRVLDMWDNHRPDGVGIDLTVRNTSRRN